MRGLPIWHSNEGFTVDVIYRILRGLLSAWYWLPSTYLGLVRIHAIQAPNHAVHGLYTSHWFTITLYGWVFIGAALSFSAWLDSRSRNGWTSGQSWVWKQEVAVVTGASGGLGSAIIQRLVKKGVKVAALDVTPPLDSLPAGATFFRADVTRRDHVLQVAEQVVKELSHPTILINNAGVVRAGSILNAEENDVDLTYGVNVKAHFWTVQAFLPEMIKRKHGHVVTVASSTAYVQAPNGVAYASSKAAALSFHEGLALELTHVHQAPQVRTSVICPGHIRTAMFKGFDSHLPNWLAPSLATDTVANLIEQTVMSQRSQHVIEPLYARATTLMRAMPSWMSDAALFFSKDAMEGVCLQQKRSKPKES